MVNSSFVTQVQIAVRAGGNKTRAVQQQAYMKSAIPYAGFTSPELSALLKPLLAAYEPRSKEEWLADIDTLWQQAMFREEKYAALRVARCKKFSSWLTPDTLVVWGHYASDGAWWDFVDEIASQLVKDTYAAYQTNKAVVTQLRKWAQSSDVWLKRTAILSQLGMKNNTETQLLSSFILRNTDTGVFWVNKAIGWALRDYARSDPEWVRAFVTQYQNQLSPLSVREAMKHLKSLS